jgi:hypothetical protein
MLSPVIDIFVALQAIPQLVALQQSQPPFCLMDAKILILSIEGIGSQNIYHHICPLRLKNCCKKVPNGRFIPLQRTILSENNKCLSKAVIA